MDAAPRRAAVVDRRAALWAGLIAGAAAMLVELALLGLFSDVGIWTPSRMSAAMVLGPGVLPPPAGFDLGVVMLASAIHFALSVALAYVFAFITGGRRASVSVLVGVIFGLVVYAVNFYAATALFPWFAEARGWIFIATHAAFGAVLGWVYALRTRRLERRPR